MPTFDPTRRIIENHLGGLVALDVDSMLLNYNAFGQKSRRIRSTPINCLQSAILATKLNIESPIRINEIAKIAVGPRKTLELLFKAVFDASKGQFYSHIRLTFAWQPVESLPLVFMKSNYAPDMKVPHR